MDHEDFMAEINALRDEYERTARDLEERVVDLEDEVYELRNGLREARFRVHAAAVQPMLVATNHSECRIPSCPECNGMDPE